MKRITYIFGPLLALVMTALLGSCSSQSSHQILEAVPANAAGITFVDFDRLQKAGVDLSPDRLSRYNFASATGTPASVVLADGTTISVAEAPSEESLAASGFNPSGEPDGTLKSYTNSDGLTVVVDSKTGIAYGISMSAQRAVEQAKAVAEQAARSSFASVLGLVNMFDQDAAGGAAIYGALSQALVGGRNSGGTDPQSASWLAYSIKQESDVASLSVKPVKGSGEPVEIKGLQTVQPDFLRYIPDGMNVVAAVGLTPEIDWDAAAALVGMIADRTTAGYVKAAAPYLKSIDGTVAVAVGMEGNNPADYRFFAMARMERSKINDFIGQASMLAALGGVTPEKVTDTISLIKMNAGSGLPSSIYIGEVDGYLVISSYLPDGKAQNSYASSMGGHDASAVVTIDPGTVTDPRLPAGSGLNIRLAINDSEAKARISFPGADKTPLAIIFNR